MQRAEIVTRRRKSAEPVVTAGDHSAIERLIATSAKAKACLRDHEPIDEREIVEALRAKGHSSVALDRLSNSIDKREERASQRSEIARLNKQGWPDQRIAKKLGLSRPYICNLRKVMGIAPVPPSKRRR